MKLISFRQKAVFWSRRIPRRKTVGASSLVSILITKIRCTWSKSLQRWALGYQLHLTLWPYSKKTSSFKTSLTIFWSQRTPLSKISPSLRAQNCQHTDLPAMVCPQCFGRWVENYPPRLETFAFCVWWTSHFWNFYPKLLDLFWSKCELRWG